VSKAKPKQQPLVPKAPLAEEKKSNQPIVNDGAINIKYPLLWLALAVIVLYWPTFSFGFTELDDSIFIREFGDYNEDLANVFKAFGRGLFSATKDPYYRPIFSDSMIINYMFAKQEILGYHIVNVLLHIGCVALLYQLLLKLKFRQLHSFLLAALFAVLPVLCQAVAWIPGRNDTLLGVFSLAFFINVISYSENGKSNKLVLSILFLLLALFTKETAVFVAPVAFLLLVFMLGTPLLSARNKVLYATWVGCFVVWFLARLAATVHISTSISTTKMFTDSIHRLPIILQYLGKIFLPFNLSVFPIQGDTVYYFGFAAVAILGALLSFSKEVNWRVVGVGGAIFLFFLAPALIVPSNLNEQVFEHRLYLPVIGILIILSQTALFKKLADKQLIATVAIVCGVFGVINFMHQKSFSDPHAFWSQAVQTSPNSAYANMMLGARETDLQVSYGLFHKAYRLNPDEKYLNFYYGCMLQKKDSILASEPYLLKEKKISDYYECDFYLARVAIMKSDTTGAINYLKNYLQRDANNPQANNNLLLMYMSRKQYAEAKALAANMQSRGLQPPGEILQQLNGIR
jgi:hypothetical protein